MEKIEIRAVIKYLCLKGMSPKDIHEDFMDTLGKESPSYSTVKKWAAEFKRGRESIKDDERPGRPKEATNEETAKAVHDLVMQDRRRDLRSIAEEVGISYGSVQAILTDVYGMSKVSARWVPRQLTDDQKRARLDISRYLLSRYDDEPDFIDRIVTQDETWVHHFDPESKKQSMQWKHPGSPPPKKFKRVPSAGKVMASIFWDSQGIIMIDYLAQGRTINGAYYADELRRLRQEIVRKRRGKLTQGVLLLHDNAPAHTSQVAMSAATDCGFEILPHPPYSPDLAPSDFYLFPKLKTKLRGRRFGSNEDVMEAVNQFLEDQNREFYLNGLNKLEHRWTKCIDVEGDYIEK